MTKQERAARAKAREVALRLTAVRIQTKTFPELLKEWEQAAAERIEELLKTKVW